MSLSAPERLDRPQPRDEREDSLELSLEEEELDEEFEDEENQKSSYIILARI